MPPTQSIRDFVIAIFAFLVALAAVLLAPLTGVATAILVPITILFALITPSILGKLFVATVEAAPAGVTVCQGYWDRPFLTTRYTFEADKLRFVLLDLHESNRILLVGTSQVVTLCYKADEVLCRALRAAVIRGMAGDKGAGVRRDAAW